MKITFESELMENQKHAVVMDPSLAFEVLQSQAGDSLFFSIGTDRIFYLTREVTQTSTGWNRIDLSSALSSQHGGAAVTAKAFSVAQNAQTLGIDLALVLTVGGADFLYLSLGNTNTDAAWANGVKWTAVPFDAGTAPKPLTIADVYMLNISAAGSTPAVENIFVDILRTPGNALNLLDRYYIVPGGTPQWNLHLLAIDLAAGSISNCLGQRTNDPLPGIYTFGTIGGKQELIFTPQYNYFNQDLPPSPARLTLPAGASAIASALNGSGATNLIVAAKAGLYIFTPDNQDDQANPAQIVTNSVTAGASALAAVTSASKTAVWGLNPQGNLFYVTCPAGREADHTAWSAPVPLLPKVEGFAFFLNLKAGNNVLFAHVDGQNLVQLTQDPVTGDWRQRSILLPSTRTSDMAVFDTYTTHIQVTDGNGVAVPNAAVSVTATSPVSVYMNDVYYLLSSTVAVNTTTDLTGVLTVVQQTTSLAAVCFRVALTKTPAVVANINPLSKALAILAPVQSGSDLTAVKVTNANGTQQSLVPAGVSSGNVNAAAQSIAHFVKINGGLPPDGSRAASTATRSTAGSRTAALTPPAPPVWGVSFKGGSFDYHEGEDTAEHFGLRRAAARTSVMEAAVPTVGSIGSDIEMAAGDFFRWVTQTVNAVTGFVVQEANGLYHFLATVGNVVYDVLLDCAAAVVHAVEFVFNQISVFFQDLIKWLGFVFQWSDILRTHAVLKNIFNRYLAQCITNLSTAETQLKNTFTSVQTYIDSWAGIPNNIPPSLSGGSLDSTTAKSQPAPGQNSPQSNWGMQQLKSNAGSGTIAQPNQGILGNIESIVQPLVDALGREKQVFEAAYTSLKSDVIDQIHTLTFPQFLEKVIAIIADTLLESVENVLLAALDILKQLTKGVIETLNATIDIPVISSLYKQVAGADLSMMDLTCLVAAIPVTIGYKLVKNAAPFPDDATTTALIKAPDFASIRKIYSPAQKVAARAAVASPAATISTPDNNIVVLTGGIASAVGALSLVIFSPLKQKFPETKIFPVVAGLSYLLYVAPDIMGQIPDLQNAKWWAITNQVISDLMVVKSAAVDMIVALAAAPGNAWETVSPWLDFVGNILWQVPTTAALFDSENQNTPGELNFWGGTCFDLNGIMSPAVADDSEPVSWGVLVAIASVLNLAYGAMSCAASVLTFDTPAAATSTA